MLASLRERRQQPAKLMQSLQANLRRAERHAAAVGFVEHPVRQLTAKVRALVRIDALQILAAPEGRYLERPTKQRMPAIGDPRQPQTVCRMSRVGTASNGR